MRSPIPPAAANLRALTVAVLLLAPAATLVVFGDRFDLSRPDHRILAGIYAGWILSPYLLLATLLPGARSTGRSALAFVSTLVIGAAGVGVCSYGVRVAPDAQEGLLPLMVPLWQGLAAAAVGRALGILAQRRTDP